MSLLSGTDDLDAFRAALAPLEGLDPLRKFVLAYANVSPAGGRLTERTAILEAVLFAVWQEAVASLGLRMSDPNVTAEGLPR